MGNTPCPDVGDMLILMTIKMNNQKKKISLTPAKSDALLKALNSTENEKLDFLKSIQGGSGTVVCRETSGNMNDPAYANSTYVKR